MHICLLNKPIELYHSTTYFAIFSTSLQIFTNVMETPDLLHVTKSMDKLSKNSNLYKKKFTRPQSTLIYQQAGFPQLLKNHWNWDLFQDHGKIIEFHEKILKFVEMKKSWKYHWISDQLLMEKSLNCGVDIVLTN